MDDLVDLKELIETWNYAFKVTSSLNKILEELKEIKLESRTELQSIDLQITEVNMICVQQVQILEGPGEVNVNTIRQSFSRLRKVYDWVSGSFAHLWRHLLNYQRQILRNDYEVFVERASSFFFLWKERIKKLAHKFQGYEYAEPPIDENRIRAWFTLFGPEDNMELALRLLNSVEFIRFEDIRQRYQEFYHLQLKNEKECIVLIQFLTTPESTPVIETVFAKALESCGKDVKPDDVQDFKTLLNAEDYSGKLCILVEDFVGTGTQYKNAFLELVDEDEKKKYKYIKDQKRLKTSEEKERLKNLNGIFLVYVILQEGAQKLEVVLKKYCPEFEIIKLSDTYPPKCFDTNKDYQGRTIFNSTSQTNMAKKLCYEIGYELLRKRFPEEKDRKDHALGFGDSQQLVVFSHTCPNNTLPIFWERGIYDDKQWEPLFPRPQDLVRGS